MANTKVPGFREAPMLPGDGNDLRAARRQAKAAERQARINKAVSQLQAMYDLVKSGQVDTRGISREPETGEFTLRLGGLVLPRRLKLAIDGDGDPTGAFKVTRPRLEAVQPDYRRGKTEHTHISVDTVGKIGVGVDAYHPHYYDDNVVSIFRTFVAPEALLSEQTLVDHLTAGQDPMDSDYPSPYRGNHAELALRNLVIGAEQASAEIAKRI
ncbi:MAG TPA: hypothetical protein VG604_03345 [Candidatus Saccharimonadales bacterium]|nr:hypothetical protein [Candidatus Saccharimonadales bacterium]